MVTVGILQSLVDAVSGDSADEDTFRYRCTDCGDTFERSKTRMVAVSCPSCGSADVRPAERS